MTAPLPLRQVRRGEAFDSEATAPSPTDPAGRDGRIGPNAIIRMAEALGEAVGTARTQQLFASCGLAHHLREAPQHMVDEREVAALHRAVYAELGPASARAISWDAGWRTGDYLLAHRIPRPVQRLLTVCPAPLASRILITAIARNAWTFVGSGQFRAETGKPLRLWVSACPICRELTATVPTCEYFAATFERLFRVLVHADAEVREVQCAATGGAACGFEVGWE